MRKLHVAEIEKAIAKMVITSCCNLPRKLYNALQAALDKEDSILGAEALRQLIANADIAEKEVLPLCQDTGFVVVFAEIGQDITFVGGNFEDAINRGVSIGYTTGYLRASIVSEPLFERINTKDNTPAIIHTRIVPGTELKVYLGSKGAGSENKSLVKMLIPADGIEGVKRVVLETVKTASASACPPFVVGVGIGGNLEVSALCAKRAALRDLDTYNQDPRYALLEKSWLEEINMLGIGPLGLGGYTTALKVNIEYFPTHIASLPVAVNLNCHSARHTSIVTL